MPVVGEKRGEVIEHMKHEKLINDLLNDCISLDTLANYIVLVPELDQLHDHLISIESRIKEAVNILKGD